MEELRIQRPELSENWLYEDWDNGIRIFSKEVSLGCKATSWLECTNEDKNSGNSKKHERGGQFTRETDSK